MTGVAHPSYVNCGWLGLVPSSWSTAPLWAVASCNDEVLPESTDPDEIIQYVEISGVTAGQGITAVSELSFGQAPSRARRKVRDGDVLVSTVRTYLRAIAPISSPPPNLIASTGFAVLRPRQTDASYLGYAVQAEYFISEVIARSVGVSYPAINASDLMRITVPVPSLPEQASIAAFLDHETGKIDALVEEQRRLIELLREKRQAVIAHAVTKGLDPNVKMRPSGVEWLGDVPAHWEVRRIKSILASIEQGWSPQCESYPASAGEWGVLKVGCVNGGIFSPDENKLLPSDLDPIQELSLRRGDVLVSRANTRELVGGAAFVAEDHPQLLVCDKLYRLRTRTAVCLPEFLALVLGTPTSRAVIEVEATGASSSMLNIAQSTILDMPLPLPPVAEQATIVSHVKETVGQLDLLARHATAATQLLEERRSALISAAVTGKIEVRDFVSPEEEAA